MKNIFKFLIILTALIGILFSVCIFSMFYNVPFFTDAIRTNWDLYPQLNFSFAVYIVIVGLFFITLLTVAIIVPVGPNFLKIKNEKGELCYSKKTVESIAKISFLDLADAEFSKVTAKFGKNSDKAKIYVILSPKNTNELSAITETIQNRIEASLLSSLGIAVKYVKIKVVESKLENTDSVIYNKVTEKDVEPNPGTEVEKYVDTSLEEDIEADRVIGIDPDIEETAEEVIQEAVENNSDETVKDDVEKDAVIVPEGGAL